jgi:tetratricopeptide (TPR) repeat protein
MSAKVEVARIFEEGQRLDKSLLWDWIRHYYAKGGVGVWSDGDIPFHITNTPVLGKEWARSVFTFIRDFSRLGEIDPDVPVEVFELGPGTGRHAFYLLQELKRLEPLSRAFCSQGLTFRLHLAELGVPGLESLAKHPNLQQPLKDGSLILHKFDINSDTVPAQFLPSGNDLSLPSPNPVFVVANYILDSLSYDVLRVAKGEAQIGLTRLSVKGIKAGGVPTDLPDMGERIKLTFSYPEVEAHYDEPHWNRVVSHYKLLEEETYIPFPTSSLRLAERARAWSNVATVFLVADKSFTTMQQLRELEEPELVAHGGGFSFNANLHAFGLMARYLGGKVHHTPSRDGTLDLSHVVYPSGQQDTGEWNFLEADFRLEDLEGFHAVDRFRLKESVDELKDDFSLRLCLDLLRLTGFDPQVFYELSDDILNNLDSDLEEIVELEEELTEAIPRCLALVYPLPDDVDVAFEIGRVAYRMEAYETARNAFLLSVEQCGDDPRTRFNLGLTWYYRDSFAEALEQFERALELNSDYEEAKLWLSKTKGRLLL